MERKLKRGDVLRCQTCNEEFTVTRPENPNRYCSRLCQKRGTSRDPAVRRKISAALYRGGPKRLAKPRKTTEERFEALTAPPDENGCERWLGSTRGRQGRGQFKDERNRLVYAHRWAWVRVNGPIPDDEELRNACGDSLCVNPDHWRMHVPLTLEERFLSRVEPDAGHLVWKGRLDKEGYPLMNDSSGKEVRAQRVGYELGFGRTPKRRHIHHRCGRTDCVAPWHLEEHPPHRHRAIHQRLKRDQERMEAKLERLAAKLSGRWPEIATLLERGPEDPARAPKSPAMPAELGAGPMPSSPRSLGSWARKLVFTNFSSTDESGAEDISATSAPAEAGRQGRAEAVLTPAAGAR